MLVPLFYLLFRTVGVGERVLFLFFRPRTLQVLFNSVILTISVTLAAFVLALPLAWLTTRTNLPGRRVWGLLAALPLVIPSYVGGFALVATLGPNGMLQDLLAPLGVERLPSIYGFPGALWALSLFTYPYLFMSIRAGLQHMDPALEEASRGLGFNAWQTFLRVTLPNLRPSITAGALLVALYTLSDFGAVSLLRFNSFTRAIYVQYLSSFDRSLASVLSLTLVVLTVLLLMAERRTRGRSRFYRSSAGATRQIRTIELGAWKWPALLFCAGVVSAALLVPTGVIAFWLARGLLAGEELVSMWGAVLNSVKVAGLAAIVTTVLAIPVAYFSAKYPSRFSNLVGQSVYIGYGLPGIVIALSLVFFGANFATAFYQTLTMLIFAYAVRFLPQAMGTVQANLLHMNPRLEEAGRSLGLSPRAVFFRITLPLLRPGILSGLALVFLTTIKELPATLLLSPAGFTTLATQIWSATDEAFFTRAAAPALLLLSVSALSILLIMSQESED
jgi:iron(III) transport system permease protein